MSESSIMRDGVVYWKSQGFYGVYSGGDTIRCTITSKLRKGLVGWFEISKSTNVRREVKEVRDIDQVDPVAIGDQVRFQEADGGTEYAGVIQEVLPRRSKLSRPAAGDKPLEQVIVANVDQIVPVFAARDPAPKWNLLDRHLAAAESAGVPALICITKADLIRPGDDIEEVIALYQSIGYPVYLTSIQTGQGIAEIAAALRGSLSVFIGKSGVGKTSLLNAVQPGLGLRVNQISQATGKGKHTTTHLEMFGLEDGGSIVDTPGMREFGLWYEPEDGGLAALFAEMRPYIGTCRFDLDCTHTHEPGCAVKRAVESGQISEMRYESYLRLLDSD